MSRPRGRITEQALLRRRDRQQLAYFNALTVWAARVDPARRPANRAALARVAAAARLTCPVGPAQQAPDNSEAAAPGRATALTTTTDEARPDGCCDS